MTRCVSELEFFFVVFSRAAPKAAEEKAEAEEEKAAPEADEEKLWPAMPETMPAFLKDYFSSLKKARRHLDSILGARR